MLLVECAWAQYILVDHCGSCLLSWWILRTEARVELWFLCIWRSKICGYEMGTSVLHNSWKDFIEVNRSKHVAFQLDYVLCNFNDVILTCGRNTLLYDSLFGKQVFLWSFTTESWDISECKSTLKSCRQVLCSQTTDRQKLNESIENKPFESFWYSTVDYLVLLW